MADLKIIDASVNQLASGFANIRDTLNLLSDDHNTQPLRSNVGHTEVIAALQEFNRKVDDTKIKYEKKTEKFTDFLKNVSTGSTEADNKIASSLQSAKQTQP